MISASMHGLQPIGKPPWLHATKQNNDINRVFRSTYCCTINDLLLVRVRYGRGDTFVRTKLKNRYGRGKYI